MEKSTSCAAPWQTVSLAAALHNESHLISSLSLLFIAHSLCFNSSSHGRIKDSKSRQCNDSILPSSNSSRSKANSPHSNRPATSHSASSHILSYTVYSLRTRNMDTLPFDNSSHSSTPNTQRSLSSSSRNKNL